MTVTPLPGVIVTSVTDVQAVFVAVVASVVIPSERPCTVDVCMISAMEVSPVVQAPMVGAEAAAPVG